MFVYGFSSNQQSDGIIPSAAASPPSVPIRLITGEELARELLFDGTTSAFRAFCKKSGIEPIPGRKNCFDPVAVRLKLNELQGFGALVAAGAENALTRSKMRRNG